MTNSVGPGCSQMARPRRSTGAMALAFVASAALAGCDGSGESTIAALKFCNTLARGDGTPIDIVMEIGDPAVRMTASSDTCTPAIGEKCIAVPAGRDLPIRLSFEGSTIAEGAFRVEAGESWILYPSLDAINRAPMVDGGRLRPELDCETVDLFPAP